MTKCDDSAIHSLRRSHGCGGVTLMEMLIVVGMISILAGLLIYAGGNVMKNSRVQGTKAIISTLVAALEVYKNNAIVTNQTLIGRYGVFPPEPMATDNIVNGVETRNFDINDIDNQLIYQTLSELATQNEAIGIEGNTNGYRQNHFTQPDEAWQDYGLEGSNLDELYLARASIEILHLALSQVPESREIIESLPEGNVVNIDGNAVDLTDDSNTSRDDQFVSLFEVTDAWNVPLRYRNRGKGVFPLITSAGPDHIFDTDDDIHSNDL